MCKGHFGKLRRQQGKSSKGLDLNENDEGKGFPLSKNLISVFPVEIAVYQHLNYIYLEDNNTEKGSLEYEEFTWALKQLQDKGVRIKFDY